LGNENSENSTMVCLTKLADGWKPEKCTSKAIENSQGELKVECHCESLTPITIVNDIKGLFTNSKV
jgi:hypothetical protein